MIYFISVHTSRYTDFGVHELDSHLHEVDMFGCTLNCCTWLSEKQLIALSFVRKEVAYSLLLKRSGWGGILLQKKCK